ncbi:MAG: hypothetical protein IJY99_00165 [Alphaproteobacteria bacterium]|nr:hypothetical protein [Alphaproteobacteria bacterium]
MKEKLTNFLLGSAMLSGLVSVTSSCTQEEKDYDNDHKEKTTINITNEHKKNEDNAALFEFSRSEIKFALAFVENYYPFTYYCGKAWTTGHGLTILYNADGTSKRVTPNTPAPDIKKSDIYKGRYLTFEVLPDIQELVTAPMDQNTLIATCALRFCIGRTNFKKSQYLKALNAGKTGPELAKTLSGWREQDGVPKRLYFFAALITGAIDFSDLLYLRADGCYNLKWKDIFVYKNGKLKKDKDNFCEWDFSKISKNIEKAKQPRCVTLRIKNNKHVEVACKLTKDIVPEYIWQDVCAHSSKRVNAPQPQFDNNHTATKDSNDNKTVEYMALVAAGLAGCAAAYQVRKKILNQNQKSR